ncbi:hypothetical protein FOA52_007639 [Chlamydomonas sp. UWO 241]|nr:hypothetical protein FOA52_007639 [Chlamydomonas sp. UWO 241]
MRLTPALLMAVALLAATALAVVQPIAVRQTGLQLAQEQAAASRCSSACAGRGTCNEELGRCDCTRGYTGDDCRTPPGDLAKLCSSLYFREPLGGNCMHEPGSGHCINACNARGVCLAGFCLCDAGFYGADCSLSLDASGRPALLAGTGYTPRARRPHVYIYELPPRERRPHVNIYELPQRYTTWLNMMGSDRPLTFMLHQRLLSSGARVADGETADWYLIPINMRGPGDSVKLQKAIKYIQSKWPWWDRHHGGRHVLVHVGDPGRGDVTGKVKLLTENCTYLHHWGLHRDFKLSGWKAAHRPGRDVVVPIYIGPHSGRGRIFSHSPLHPRSPEQRAAGGPAAKTLEMLFAGRICGGTEEPQPELGKGSCPRGINRGYSQGVRQAVHLYHWNRSGFSVSTKNADYQADLRRARFCLAPTGGGHGHRQILVAFAGCVPLLIGDYVYQPFEPELDWGRFSVSVRQPFYMPCYSPSYVHDVSGRDRPAGGGVVSASFLNAKPAVGGIGVEPRRGGVLRVLFTVASDAVADTVVRSRRNLCGVDPSAAVFDVLSDREEAQHRALWPAFFAAKAAGKRAQFHRARLVVDGERGRQQQRAGQAEQPRQQAQRGAPHCGSQRRAWDSSQLRRPAVRREFNLQLSDHFGLLEAVPPEGADAQAEYDAMAAAIREVATNHLAPRGSRRRRGWQFTLSQRTLRLMDARQRAHTAWLRSKSAAAKRERNRANRAADAAVQRDRERWIGQQVAEAQDMLRKKNLRQFARACDRLAGRSRSHQIPPAMRDVSGALHSGPDGVLKAMTESFQKLYGGETKLSDETLNQLKNDVAAFELTRATEVDEARRRPPDLAETEACVDIPDLHTRLAGIDAHAYTDLQAALACAAEHLTWSSIIGGFKWDTGKYDAFETTLEILRSMLAHPGVPPERLREVDAELAAFMECRSGGGGRGGDAPQAATVPSAPQDMVCSLSKFDEEATRDPCSGCVSRSTGVVPGGMACCGAASLGRCPRLWD